MLCRICTVQIRPRKHLLDHAEDTAPTLQHELDHTDRTDQKYSKAFFPGDVKIALLPSQAAVAVGQSSGGINGRNMRDWPLAHARNSDGWPLAGPVFFIFFFLFASIGEIARESADSSSTI